jgi:hypothetical protein
LSRFAPGPEHRNRIFVARINGLREYTKREDLCCQQLHIFVQIGLADDYDSVRIALTSKREVSLESRNVEVLVCRGNDEQRVNVGRNELNLPASTRCLAAKHADPIEHTEGYSLHSIDQQPVPDGYGHFTVNDESLRQLQRCQSRQAGNDQCTAFNAHNTHRQSGIELVCAELRLEELPPAEFG